jgi:hypothetical protein
MYDNARQQALGPIPKGPFSGVPFLLKDFLAEFAGVAAAGEILGVPRILSLPLAAFFVWGIVLRASYRTVEKVFLVACLFYLSYVAAGLYNHPPGRDILKALTVPAWRSESAYLIMLIGLAAKNAILIVEFAKVLHEQGKDLITAALEAAKLRFRPILMTASITVFSLIPLLFATGPGAEVQRPLAAVVVGETVVVVQAPWGIVGVELRPEAQFVGQGQVEHLKLDAKQGADAITLDDLLDTSILTLPCHRKEKKRGALAKMGCEGVTLMEAGYTSISTRPVLSLLSPI